MRVTVLGLLCCTVIAAFAYLNSNNGKQHAARWLEARLSRELPGRVEIEAIDSLNPNAFGARGVTFRDPKGNVVLRADHATIDLDLGSALRGTLGFDRATVDGGLLVLAVQPDGRTSLEAAFAPPSKAPADPNRGLQCSLRDIHAEHLTVKLDLSKESKDQSFVFKDVTSTIRIWRDHTPGIRVEMSGISARVATPNLLGKSVSLVRAEGSVRGAESHVLHMTFATRVEDAGRVDGKLDYFDRQRRPVLVDLYPRGNGLSDLAAALVDARTWFTDAVKVDVH